MDELNELNREEIDLAQKQNVDLAQGLSGPAALELDDLFRIEWTDEWKRKFIQHCWKKRYVSDEPFTLNEIKRIHVIWTRTEGARRQRKERKEEKRDRMFLQPSVPALEINRDVVPAPKLAQVDEEYEKKNRELVTKRMEALRSSWGR